MIYLALRDLHITCVILSGTGFFLRGIWRLVDSPLVQRRWVKILPHLIDTVLLSSAIALAVLSQQYPIEQAWLSAKVIGLLSYIGCGMAAFRFSRDKKMMAVFFVLALCSYAYIVSVALTRYPAAWLAIYS
jgi:uncharacterized membrane protein SirB2